MERIARSMNASLIEGASDGAIKKARRDVETDNFDDTVETRRPLFEGEGGYGYLDASNQIFDYLSGTVRGT